MRMRNLHRVVRVVAGSTPPPPLTQVYFSQSISRYTRYKRMLAGFTKVPVPASSSTDVALSIPFADLAYWDPKATGPVSGFVLEAGEYSISVCAHSGDCPSSNTHVVAVPDTVENL